MVVAFLVALLQAIKAIAELAKAYLENRVGGYPLFE